MSSLPLPESALGAFWPPVHFYRSSRCPHHQLYMLLSQKHELVCPVQNFLFHGHEFIHHLTNLVENKLCHGEVPYFIQVILHCHQLLPQRRNVQCQGYQSPRTEVCLGSLVFVHEGLNPLGFLCDIRHLWGKNSLRVPLRHGIRKLVKVSPLIVQLRFILLYCAIIKHASSEITHLFDVRAVLASKLE